MSTKRKHENEDPEFSHANKWQRTGNKAGKKDDDDSRMFEKVPVEVKEMIIDYLPGKDLLSLAATNKTFHQLIGNKSKYMDKIALRVPVGVKVNWTNERKYEHLIFKSKITTLKEFRLTKEWLEDLKEDLKDSQSIRLIFWPSLLMSNESTSKNSHLLKMDQLWNCLS